MKSRPEKGEVAAGTWRLWHDPGSPIRLGVSSCLLGNEVRHDGGHARDRFVSDELGAWVEWVTVCPEVEIGLPVPRPTIRLVDEGDGVRLLVRETGQDLTDAMEGYSAARLAALREQGLDGFVLKKNSPSCGMERIRVHRGGGLLHKKGAGIFAAAIALRWPELPVEEEGRLEDPGLRENFIERIFCRNRWRTFVARGASRHGLVLFHTAHKLLLRAHDESGYRELGRIVSGMKGGTLAGTLAAYEHEFQRTLSRRMTPRKHANVLQHALGYLKDKLESREKREILTAIEDHRTGLLPLIVPLTLLRFNIVRHDVEYLRDQIYFDPHPKELMLRNHV